MEFRESLLDAAEGLETGMFNVDPCDDFAAKTETTTSAEGALTRFTLCCYELARGYQIRRCGGQRSTPHPLGYSAEAMAALVAAMRLLGIAAKLDRRVRGAEPLPADEEERITAEIQQAYVASHMIGGRTDADFRNYLLQLAGNYARNYFRLLNAWKRGGECPGCHQAAREVKCKRCGFSEWVPGCIMDALSDHHTPAIDDCCSYLIGPTFEPVVGQRSDEGCYMCCDDAIGALQERRQRLNNPDGPYWERIEMAAGSCCRLFRRIASPEIAARSEKWEPLVVELVRAHVYTLQGHRPQRAVTVVEGALSAALGVAVSLEAIKKKKQRERRRRRPFA